MSHCNRRKFGGEEETSVCIARVLLHQLARNVGEFMYDRRYMENTKTDVSNSDLRQHTKATLRSA